MIHTIYLDILFCVNFIVDYVILLTVRCFLSLSCRRARLLLGAAVGGLSSFVILLPPLPSGVSLCMDLLTAFLVIGAVFAPMGKKQFIKTAGAFFLISFGYCGAMIALWLLFTPDHMIIRNGSVYIDIAPMELVITTLFSYVIIRVIMRISGRGELRNVLCRVRLRYQGKDYELKGKIDTGHTLKEPFSGESVIVVSTAALGEENTDITEQSKTGFRVIPFTSVGGEGLLKAFKNESITVLCGKREYHLRGYIALCDRGLMTDGIQALVPGELVE